MRAGEQMRRSFPGFSCLDLVRMRGWSRSCHRRVTLEGWDRDRARKSWEEAEEEEWDGDPKSMRGGTATPGPSGEGWDTPIPNPVGWDGNPRTQWKKVGMAIPDP